MKQRGSNALPLAFRTAGWCRKPASIAEDKSAFMARGRGYVKAFGADTPLDVLQIEQDLFQGHLEKSCQVFC